MEAERLKKGINFLNVCENHRLKESTLYLLASSAEQAQV